MRWVGFRRVRRQVCKRIARRLIELGLQDLEAYRTLLGADAGEWSRLDSLCRITISRFYRDRAVWNYLGDVLLPDLTRFARRRGDEELRCWSVGCASGEEPYTLAMVWRWKIGAAAVQLPFCNGYLCVSPRVCLRLPQGRLTDVTFAIDYPCRYLTGAGLAP